MILLIMKLPRESDAQGDYEGLRQILSHSFSSATILLKMKRVACTLNDEKEGSFSLETQQSQGCNLVQFKQTQVTLLKVQVQFTGVNPC